MPRRIENVSAVVEENPVLAAAVYDTGIDPNRLLAELQAMVDEQSLGGDAA